MGRRFIAMVWASVCHWMVCCIVDRLPLERRCFDMLSCCFLMLAKSVLFGCMQFGGLVCQFVVGLLLVLCFFFVVRRFWLVGCLGRVVCDVSSHVFGLWLGWFWLVVGVVLSFCRIGDGLLVLWWVFEFRSFHII